MSDHYDPGKSNVVSDALSLVSMCSVTHVVDDKKDIVKYIHRLLDF